MKKISILIANYNNGKYFQDCYESLVDQTYENWEAIIVDDASTDNSLSIIYNIIKDDPRCKLYKNTTNKGCGFSKRECVTYATGDICGFLDPDDALFPEALERSMREYINNNIVATYSKMMRCDEKLIEQEVFVDTKQIYNYRYFFNCPIQFAHFFTFKRETYLKTSGINPSLKSSVDQDLYLKILELGNVSFIKETLYKYRLHSHGISQENSKEDAKNSFAKVIFYTMHRRGIEYINNRKVPNKYENSEEIYELLTYQVSFFYKLKIKFKLLFRNLSLFI